MRIAHHVTNGSMIESLECRKLLSAGQLDATFSGDGRLIGTFAEQPQINGGAVQSDGKIIVVGETNILSNGAHDFCVARYTSSGSLDTSFSGDGVATVSFGADATANDVAIDSSGRIVVAGAADGQFAVARLLSNGSLDTSFSTDGKQTVDNGGAGAPALGASSIAIQSDGKIVLGGGSGFTLARLTTSGDLDSSFGGGDGKVTVGNGLQRIRDIALAPDGRIIAGGSGDFSAAPDAAIARFNSDGTLDSSFTPHDNLPHSTGGQGYAIFEFDTGGGLNSFDDNGVNGVAVQTDGKIVMTGFSNEFFLTTWRIDSTGNADIHDLAFDLGAESSIGRSVSVQSDGKIVVGGITEESEPSEPKNFLLIRYNANGTRDTTFGVNGVVETELRTYVDGGGGENDLSELIVAGGKYIAVGTEDQESVAIARYDGGDTQYVSPVTTLGDGSIQIVGTNGNDAIHVYRYNSPPDTNAVDVNGAIIHISASALLRINTFDGNDFVGFNFDASNPAKIDGGAGNDSLGGSQGQSTIWGGDGNDFLGTVTEAAYSGTMTVFGGIGQDKIQGGDNADLIFGEGGNDYLYGNGGGDHLEGGGGWDFVYGMGGDDDVIGNSGNDHLEGGAGDDHIEGQSGNDGLYGNEGDDFLFAGSDNDVVDGGFGADYMEGDDGVDWVTYESRLNPVVVGLGTAADDGEAGEGDNARDDIENIIGGAGNDDLRGSASANKIYGVGGSDLIYLHGGNDYAEGGSGNDTIYGEGDNDSLYGNSGADRLDGGSNDDQLDGGSGADQFFGQSGNDTIFAKDGEKDLINGGSGTDTAQRDNSANVKDDVLSIETFVA